MVQLHAILTAPLAVKVPPEMSCPEKLTTVGPSWHTAAKVGATPAVCVLVVETAMLSVGGLAVESWIFATGPVLMVVQAEPVGLTALKPIQLPLPAVPPPGGFHGMNQP